MNDNSITTEKKQNNPPNHGVNVKRARKFRDFTSEDLAKIIGISKSTVLNWEKEEVLPDDVLAMVSKATGIELYVLRDHHSADTTIAPKSHIEKIESTQHDHSTAFYGSEKIDVKLNTNADAKDTIAQIVQTFADSMKQTQTETLTVLSKIADKL